MRLVCSWDGCPWQLRVTPYDLIADTNAAGARHLVVAHRTGEGPLDGAGEELTGDEWAAWQPLERLLRERPAED